MPGSELAEVRYDALRVRPEVMRTIWVDQHACVVVTIVGVSADVVTTVYDQASCPSLARETFRQDSPGKSRPNDQVIPLHRTARSPNRLSPPALMPRSGAASGFQSSARVH